MQKEKQHFLKGALANGYTKEMAETIFALIEPFAGYAFNKAHSVSYALVAYQTAYLKANYPAAYMAALLSVYAENTEKIISAFAECRRLGIRILPPDINHSLARFSLEKDDTGKTAIRFSLAAIKNVGEGAVAPLIKERQENGPFVSLEDLCRRADLSMVNRRVLESLVRAGALDCLGDRATLLYNLESILSLVQRQQRLRESGQSTMFDLFGDSAPTPLPLLELEAAEVAAREKLAWEKELIGVYLSEHPFSAFVAHAVADDITLCGQIEAENEGQSVRVAGMVASVQERLSRRGQAFATVMLEDLDGSIEVMVWFKVYNETRQLWREGAIVLVEGKVRLKDDHLQISCDAVKPYQPGAKTSLPPPPEAAPTLIKEETEAETTMSKTSKLTLSLKQSGDKEKDVATLRDTISTLEDFPGDDEVNFRIVNSVKVYYLRMPHLAVNYSPKLHQRLKELLGETAIRLEV